MKRWTKRHKKIDTGRVVMVALILFVMLCGLTLVVAGGKGTGCNVAENKKHKEALLTKVLEEVNIAAQSLEATDYGKTKFHLYRARNMITRVVLHSKE